jgi:glutamate racemase
MKLGILDWGIGGFGTLKQIPNFEKKEIVYLSDAGYTPYGKVEKSELEGRIKQCISFLRSEGADYVFVACNSAGTVTAETEYSGSIIPYGIKMIRELKEKVLILGGDRTVSSRIFGMKENYQYQSGQALSALIEQGKKEDAMKLLRPILVTFDGRTMLHACTHYPALFNQLSKEFPYIMQLDPAESASLFLKQKDINSGRNIFYTTGDCKQSNLSAQLAFGVDKINFTKINIS